jgi:hypothetical protein
MPDDGDIRAAAERRAVDGSAKRAAADDAEQQS